MIRYNTSLAKLRTLVRNSEGARDDWLDEAERRTEEFRNKGEYVESSSIWSEVKPVYMELQNDKCAYCEQKLEGGARGRIQHDLEHFRPKGKVRAWPTKKLQKKLKYTFKTGDAMSPGYFLLAYNLLNYCASCKTCNSPLKSDYFPIAGNRMTGKDDPKAYKGEEPDLIYPLGKVDADPATIITFDGIVAVPKFGSGKRHRRARVTIDFFELNGREPLRVERAFLIDLLVQQMRIVESRASGIIQKDAKETRDLLLSPGAPHSSCLDAFAKLWASDRPRAESLAVEYKKLAKKFFGL